MNKLTSPEPAAAENTDISIREEYKYPFEDTALKFVLYSRDIPEGKSYSIQCVKYIDGVKVCQSTAADVSTKYDYAVEMYEKIAEGEVEPIILHDVVYDLLP